MKKVLLLGLLFLQMLVGASVFAQSSSSVSLNSITLDAASQMVQLSIKTTEEFVVGSNRYILHIGGKHFLINQHPDGRLDEIIFSIPLADYEQLISGSKIFLVYGYYYENTKLDFEGSSDAAIMGTHWVLGNFKPQTF